MSLDPSQLVSAAACGLVLGAAKAIDWLTKHARNRALQRQFDRLEAKVDRLIENDNETHHRLSRVEEAVGFTPTDVRRMRANGVRG